MLELFIGVVLLYILLWGFLRRKDRNTRAEWFRRFGHMFVCRGE